MKKLILFTLAAMCLFTFVAPTTAMAQRVPEDEQSPWKCYDIEGWERPCTITEEFGICMRAAQDAEIQCAEEGGVNPAALLVCGGKRATDDAGCWASFIEHFWFV